MAVYTYTLVTRAGAVVQFETHSLETDTDSSGKLNKLKAAKKDQGLSLMYCDPSEVAAIVRDSRPVEAE